MNAPDERRGPATNVVDEAIDWHTLESSAEAASDPELLRQLKVISAIGAVHRREGRQDPLTSGRMPDRQWGRLTILDTIGAGAFGTVFRAWDPELERTVALKVYTAPSGDSPQDVSALLSEGRRLARVRHPNVVRVHGVDRSEREVGLWLELIDGQTLADEVSQRGALGYREAAIVGVDLCRALAAVHRAGLIHRDVKPRNVMRENGGRIVLMDFGLGCEGGGAQPDAASTGGTPLYMAPELFAEAPASARTDIYSLGVLLFYLVTGEHPVVARTRADLETAHRSGQRRWLRDVRPDLPGTFVEVVERAIDPDPQRRFDSAGSMEYALSGVLGMGATARRSEAGAAQEPWFARRRIMYAAAAAVAMAIVAVPLMVRRPPVDPAVPEPRVERRGSDGETTHAPTYTIQASFHRQDSDRSDVLATNEVVRPGDRLFLELEASQPVHVYVVNQDERGESYLLFPLAVQNGVNPLSGGRRHRIPGVVGGEELYWQVTSAGGQEYFLVVASPEPLAPLERALAGLPKPIAGRPVATGAQVPGNVIGQLRGVGGLARDVRRDGPAPLIRSAGVLGGRELVTGPWMRQFVLRNPAQ